jgi:hypothetical protein
VGIDWSDARKANEWRGYLAGLSGPNAILARDLWSKVCASAVVHVPVPHAGPLPDGGFQFVWDNEPHHLEVDILPDGSMEWFYRNRKTDEFDGDDFSGGFPEALQDRFTLFGRGQGPHGTEGEVKP